MTDINETAADLGVTVGAEHYDRIVSLLKLAGVDELVRLRVMCSVIEYGHSTAKAAHEEMAKAWDESLERIGKR